MRSRLRDRPLIPLLVLGAIVAAVGIAIGLSIRWFPTAASSQAHKIDTLYDVLIIASVPMFVLVVSVVLYSVWRFRMRPGEENRDGPPIHGNTRLEVIWTAFPAILLISLCSYAYVVLRDFERKPAGPQMEVNVTSQQFAWSFEYPKSATSGAPVESTQLYVPQNESIQFHVHSKDVIHAFWVPAFRLQIDAVPGQTEDVRATPTRLGSYPLVCAELCGLGHSAMRTTVHVLTKRAFASWLRSQHGSGSPGASSPPAPPSSSADRPSRSHLASAGSTLSASASPVSYGAGSQGK